MKRKLQEEFGWRIFLFFYDFLFLSVKRYGRKVADDTLSDIFFLYLGS